MPIPIETTVVALMGLPRSGTTLLTRHIGAHSRIAVVMEPYQRRRRIGYTQTQLQELCTDFKVEVPSAGGILIKETGTRSVNIDLVLKTLGSAAEQGHPTGIILMLRSPIEAYYSQIEAFQTYWKDRFRVDDKGNAAARFGDHEDSVARFWMEARRSFQFLHREIYRFPFRISFFHRFLADPKHELSRLMAFFPVELEASQFDAESARKKGLRGGDPKAWDRSKAVSPSSVTDRSGKFEEFRTRFANHPAGSQMLRIHHCITKLQRAALFDDDEICARLFLEFRKLPTLPTKSAGRQGTT
jgi:hypothetical protein